MGPASQQAQEDHGLAAIGMELPDRTGNTSVLVSAIGIEPQRRVLHRHQS